MARKDLPSPSSPNYLARVREEIHALLGKTGNAKDRALTLEDAIASGVIATGPGGSLVPGPGAGAESYEPDLTPPPTPDSLTASPAISHILLEVPAATYTQGHGHLRTRVYGAILENPGDPLPVFADAVEVGQFEGTVWAMPSNPSTTWHLWAKWETRDGVLSASPVGGTNGVVATTGQDVAPLVAALTGPGKPFKLVEIPYTLADGTPVPAGVYASDAYLGSFVAGRGQIGLLAVDDARIASMSVSKLTAGSLAVGRYAQSTGYVAGSSGWRINGDGTAEFSDVVVRGTVFATDGQFFGTLLGGGASDYGSGLGFFSGWSGSESDANYRWRVGSTSGARIQWSGNAVEVYDEANRLTMASGLINAQLVGQSLSDSGWGSQGAVLAATLGGQVFCVVGEGGRVATSSNGVAWVFRGGLQATEWGLVDAAQAIAWNGSVFCIAGVAGKVATSPDGVTWTYQAGLRATAWGTAAGVRSIAWNGSLFCAVGESGRVATSPDGVTWTYRSSLSSTTWGTAAANAVVWTGTQFCVVGDGGRVATSSNGSTWTYRSGLRSTSWGTSAAARAIAWNGSFFCAVGDAGSVATSPDGSTWTFRSSLRSTAWGNAANVLSVSWDGARFCAGGAGGRVATSADGSAWVYQSSLSLTQWGSEDVRALLPAQIKIFAFGSKGLTASSPDGVVWTYWAGFGQFSRLNQLTSENVGVYMASGAIGNAFIGKFIASDNFNGTLDANGNITANGSAGWAIGKGGKAVFQDAVVRGDVQATSLNAATGTFSGSLTADAVNAVDTINLAGNSVTVPGSATTTSNFSTGVSTEQVVLSFTLDSDGAPVWVCATGHAGLYSYNGGAGTFFAKARIKVNGSVVAEANEAGPFAISRQVAGGNLTIQLTVLRTLISGTNVSGNVTLSSGATLFAIGTKR